MASDAPLVIHRQESKFPGTRILRVTGPLTLRNLFDFQGELRGFVTPQVTIVDLAGVPYMDSAGMGALINYHVHCEKLGKKMIVSGISSRVMELFRMTKVDTVMAQAESVEAAEGQA